MFCRGWLSPFTRRTAWSTFSKCMHAVQNDGRRGNSTLHDRKYRVRSTLYFRVQGSKIVRNIHSTRRSTCLFFFKSQNSKKCQNIIRTSLHCSGIGASVATRLVQLNACRVFDGSAAGEAGFSSVLLSRHLCCSQHLPWSVLFVGVFFAPVVARVVTNAKRCLPWTSLFP